MKKKCEMCGGSGQIIDKRDKIKGAIRDTAMHFIPCPECNEDSVAYQKKEYLRAMIEALTGKKVTFKTVNAEDVVKPKKKRKKVK